MTNQPTPEKIKAFLDDLARISLRYGFQIVPTNCGAYLEKAHPEFEKYFSRMAGGVTDGFPLHGHLVGESDYVDSIDITKLSKHQKIEILGARSPELAQMLRDAFMAGVNVTGQGWTGENPGDNESRARFEEEAAEYAAKIMGGLG